MQIKRSWIFGAILLVLALIIRLYSASNERVETGYSNGIYPPIGAFFRTLLGWIPFSFGDILYAIAIGWLLWKAGRHTRSLYLKRVNRRSIWKALVKSTVIFLLLYIVFNLFWGMNYNRKGIAYQLNLDMKKYSLEDLKQVNGLLVEKVNLSKRALLNSKVAYPSNRELFRRVKEAYDRVDSVYPFLRYRTASIKPSMWGWLGNYMGFTGYYNPFTGEAQVNTNVPKFLLPYTSCHEVAHQLGYAKEMEANFVGYIAASNSADTLFHYSVYLDLFMYSNRNLMGKDSLSAKENLKALLPEVKDDIREWREFNRRHKNPFEPVVRWIYGRYLQSNQQPAGIFSYDEVTGFIIAYHKKFGKI